ncbi:hypothetical protein QBC36DRAFT_350873 [Triangularia setosa]|uniref:NodB homology domain-containing protein n=1 Tax=Triangularia setosa TaxID=2587417 RepID=A0AAN6VVW2_9PEZI|nr:hypothetical protein QBC36DRAFT_350873 [Podospora setosa]
MLTGTLTTGLLLIRSASALPVMSPLDYIKRAVNPGVVIRQCTQPNMLALAYDDDPYTYTPQLVDILDKGGAKATFFWCGTLCGCIYRQEAAVKNAYASGHQVASQSWSHNRIGSMKANQIRTEIIRVEDALVNMVGVKPAYMRPPFLDTGGQFLNTMKTVNYKVITNDIDSGDWNNQQFQQAGARGNGHIPPMHEVYPGTVNTLTPLLINWANQNGLKLVTVAECAGDPEGSY